jgi:hypothetical protein
MLACTIFLWENKPAILAQVTLKSTDFSDCIEPKLVDIVLHSPSVFASGFPVCSPCDTWEFQVCDLSPKIKQFINPFYAVKTE